MWWMNLDCLLFSAAEVIDNLGLTDFTKISNDIVVNVSTDIMLKHFGFLSPEF